MRGREKNRSARALMFNRATRLKKTCSAAYARTGRVGEGEKREERQGNETRSLLSGAYLKRLRERAGADRMKRKSPGGAEGRKKHLLLSGLGVTACSRQELLGQKVWGLSLQSQLGSIDRSSGGDSRKRRG